jgi:hypothetical protein
MFLFNSRKELPLTKISGRTVPEITSKSKPQPEAQALLAPGLTPLGYVLALEENKHALDAVNFIAHGLPEREAVWWACQSARTVAEKLNSAERAALAAAEAWVRSPSPEKKAAAAAAAAKTEFKGPGGWAAQAAGWTQDPAPLKPAPKSADAAPPPVLTPPAVGGAILLAAGLAGKSPMPEVPPAKPAMPAAPALPGKPNVNLKAPDASALAGAAGAIKAPNPNISVPGVAAPALPTLAVPAPGLQAPAISAPGLPAPGIPATPAIPGIPAPGVPAMPAKPGMPQVTVPKPAAPGVSAPKIEAPGGLPKPKVPAPDAKKLAKMLQPYLDLGKDVASGKNAWG